MQDTFKCTPEILCEFFDSLPRDSDARNFFQQWDSFKSSKSPKKEWEIVAFRHARGSMLVYKLREDGRYRSDDVPYSDGFTMEQMVEDGEIIHSVRRLSDGEVFSVGDRIATPLRPDGIKITGFQIEKEQLWVNQEAGYFSVGDGAGAAYFKETKKLPQPILTTADQKDLFSRQDGVWVVNKDNEIIHRYVDTILDHGYVFQDCRFYSTPEAARDYLLNHAPLLSLNDVKEAIGSNDVFGTLALRERLTALVRQKLN